MFEETQRFLRSLDGGGQVPVLSIHPVKAAAKSGLTVAFHGDHLK